MKHTWTYEPDGDLEEYDMVFFTSVRVAMKAVVDAHLNRMKPGDKIEIEINVWRPEQKSQDGERIYKKMKDIIKMVEEIWNDSERQKEREKILAEMEKKGEAERIDDVLLIKLECIERREQTF